MQQLGTVRRIGFPRAGFGDGNDGGFFDPTFDPGYVTGGDSSQNPTYTPPIYAPPPSGSNPPASSGQPSVFSQSLPAIIAAGLKTISNIWAPVGTSVAQAQGGSAYQNPYALQQQPVYRNGQLVGYGSAGQQVVGAAGGALQSVGNLFGVSGTAVLLVGGGLLLFLFMKPPGRR